MSRWDVIIVGGGPAGCAAALQLVQRDSSLRERTLLIDSAVFPRHKLCGGGVVRRADELLASLEFVADVPSVPIHAIRFVSRDGEVTHQDTDAFRVVRREDFDHALLLAVRAAGVTVREGEKALALERTPEGILIRTSADDYLAQVVVGADGARSRVRRALVDGDIPQRFVTIEVLTEEDGRASEFRDHTAVFDFRLVPDGLRGYAWDFPSIKEGRPFMNRGIGGTEWSPTQPLKRALESRLTSLGVLFSAATVEGAAVPLYHPMTRQSSERVVLAGDAVGIDPLMGEGISVAIGTGMLAAHAIADGLHQHDLAFADYRKRIADSSVGYILRRNWIGSGLFYHRLKQGDPIDFPRSGLH